MALGGMRDGFVDRNGCDMIVNGPNGSLQLRMHLAPGLPIGLADVIIEATDTVPLALPQPISQSCLGCLPAWARRRTGLARAFACAQTRTQGGTARRLMDTLTISAPAHAATARTHRTAEYSSSTDGEPLSACAGAGGCERQDLPPGHRVRPSSP